MATAYEGKTTALLFTRAQRLKIWARRVDWYQSVSIAVLLILALAGVLQQALPRSTVYILVKPTPALELRVTAAPVIVERVVIATATAGPAQPAEPAAEIAVAPVPAEQPAAPVAEPVAPAQPAEPAAEIAVAPVPAEQPAAPPAAPLEGWGGGGASDPTPGFVDRVVGNISDAVGSAGNSVIGPAVPTMPPNGWGGGAGKGW